MSTIEIRAKSNADSYWVRVDRTDVHMWGPTGDAVGTLEVPAGSRTLFWGMFGDPDEALSLEVSQNGAVIATASGRILAGGTIDGGYTPFDVA